MPKNGNLVTIWLDSVIRLFYLPIIKMSPVSLFPILPILLLALATMHLISKVIPIHTSQGHYDSIDGLRGYLALFVFLHHSTVWYFFLLYHRWSLPPSRTYHHFGPTSVSFFFMITAFLFFTKLLRARSGSMDWLKLYVGRVLRIYPLYLLVVFSFFLIVGIISNFTLHVPFGIFISQVSRWLFFMTPDVNAINRTGIIIAGVIWSLAFEWIFYFSLSFIGVVFFKIKTSALTLVLTGILLVFFVIIVQQYYPYFALLRISSFSGGIVAAFLVKNPLVRKLAASKAASFLIILLLISAVLFSPVDAYEQVLSLICMIFAFIGIACGNTLFGILTNITSRLLGQISYSIYLLHGIVLFLTFRFVIGFRTASALSPYYYWMVISGAAICLIIIASFSYYRVELPFINATSGVVERIKNFFGKRPMEQKLISK
jgi:peptidoglycan/LPS O-acetylase OafA/YrhL